MAKVTKTTSTDELYVRKWYFQSLAFLQPVMRSSRSRNTVKQSNEGLDEIGCTEVKAYSGLKKK